MARNVSAIVSGLGFGCGFLTALDKERQKLGVSDEDFHAAIKEESPLIKKFADLIAESCKPKLLELVGTIDIPVTTERFVAKDRFVLDTSASAKVKISYLGDNFKAKFLEKIEEPFSGSTLCASRLRESSLDAPIIAELGGEEKSETTLAEIFSLMEKQPSGEQGKLLTNGYANIFYVRDAKGVLCAVYVRWSEDGWSVFAFSISFPFRWFGGRQIFSRNSFVLEPSETLVPAQA